mmetsp:Transcript_156069/g.500540  ORF Transcript_156069/g.500540 Transcript_156069/m.500540 type:complete len:717 (+) Transcript_156069:176-2326(+)
MFESFAKESLRLGVPSTPSTPRSSKQRCRHRFPLPLPPPTRLSTSVGFKCRTRLSDASYTTSDPLSGFNTTTVDCSSIASQQWSACQGAHSTGIGSEQANTILPTVSTSFDPEFVSLPDGDSLMHTYSQGDSPPIGREERIARSIQRLIVGAAPPEGVPVAPIASHEGSTGSTNHHVRSRQAHKIEQPTALFDLFGPGGLADGLHAMQTTGSCRKRPGKLVALRDVLEVELDHIRERRVENKKYERRLEAFDRRRIAALNANMRPPKMLKQNVADALLELFKAPKSRLIAQKAQDEALIAMTESSELQQDGSFELNYDVSRCSSQHAENRCTNVKNQGGRWETVVGGIKHESLTFELVDAPGSVTAIEFGILEVMGTPRRCRLQYSVKGPNGPWQEAWKFAVCSPGGEVSFRSDFEYGSNARQFSEAILGYFDGDEHSAWKFLDVNGTSTIAMDELLELCRQLQQVRGNPKAAAVAAVNLQSLFKELDSELAGSVSIKELVVGEAKPPSAKWWRLHIIDNWGSANSIVVGGPLKLMSPVPQNRSKGLVARFPEAQQSPQVEGFGLPHEPSDANNMDKQLRHLSFEHGLKYSEVEDMYNKFMNLDLGGDGVISREEFEILVVKVYNLSDSSDLAPSRFDIFWKQVDQDGNGCIDFSEFLSWHKMMVQTKHRGGGGQPWDMLGASRLDTPSKQRAGTSKIQKPKREEFASYHGSGKEG